MNVNVIPAHALTSDLLALWAEIQEGNPELANPCFRPELIQIHASERLDVEVAILDEGGEVVGFLPFARGKNRVGRPTAFADYQGMIARQGAEWDPQEVVRGCGLVAWDFNRLLASQAPFRPYHSGVQLSAVMDLSNGYEAYAAERRSAGSDIIKQCETLRRKLERKIAPLRFEAHVEDTSLLQQLLHWRESKHGRRGNSSASTEPTWVYRVLEKVLLCQTEHFRGVLSALYAGDEVVAAHFGMQSREVFYGWWQSYNPRFEKYSPGIMLLVNIAAKAASRRIRLMDLSLVGKWQYKQRLMNATIPVAAGSVEIPSWVTTMRRLRRTTATLTRRIPRLHRLANRGARLLGFSPIHRKAD